MSPHDALPGRPLPRGGLAAVGLVLVLAILGGVGAGVWRGAADPREDARAFLAPYQERKNDAGTGRGYLVREAWFADEARRMAAALPRAHGWSLRRVTEPDVPTIEATAAGGTRLQTFLSRIGFPGAGAGLADTIKVKLSSRYASPSRLRDPLPYRQGAWTTATVETMGRDYPFRLSPSPPAITYTVPVPAAPGLKVGEAPKP